MEDEIQKKKSGKRKIEIKPILNKPSKQVTFSKRKTGLFKKASELCSLCGAEMAVITFSSAGKLFSFGHPNADDIISRYLHFSDCKNNIQTPNNNNPINYGSNSNISKISEHYKEVLTNINLEKKSVLTSSNNNCNKFDYWWDVPIDESMGLNELEQLKVALEGLRVEVASRIDGINNNNNNNNNNTNCSSMMSEFSGNADEFGSSDGNNNGGNYEDSAVWNNGDQGLVIPSFSPLMMNSLFENNASENLAIFQ